MISIFSHLTAAAIEPKIPATTKDLLSKKANVAYAKSASPAPTGSIALSTNDDSAKAVILSSFYSFYLYFHQHKKLLLYQVLKLDLNNYSLFLTAQLVYSNLSLDQLKKILPLFLLE